MQYNNLKRKTSAYTSTVRAEEERQRRLEALVGIAGHFETSLVLLHSANEFCDVEKNAYVTLQ